MKQNEKQNTPGRKHDFRPDRLLDLAEHLEKGNLYFLNKIDIKDIRLSEPELYSEHLPVVAHPLYELVHLFPNDWNFDDSGYPVYKGDEFKNPVSSLWTYFGINCAMIRHLFVPHHQNVRMFGGKRLTASPSDIDIAHNIRELVKEGNAFLISKMYPSNLN